tara:strand:- start:216 stop:704 length:489 start_codon:yes stop_codon:yes gene_type:complete
VRELAKRAGARLDQRYGHLLLKLKLMHVRQDRTAESRAQQIAGVLEAAISPAGVLRIEFDRETTDEATIRMAVEKIGIHATEKEEQPPPAEPNDEGDQPAAKEHNHGHGGLFGEKAELGFSLLCGGLLLTGWLLSTFNTAPTIPGEVHLHLLVCHSPLSLLV